MDKKRLDPVKVSGHTYWSNDYVITMGYDVM